jgi:hypothetical protein
MNGLLRRCTSRVALALLTLSFSWQAASAAPAPFDRTAVRTKQLCRGDLVGTWTLVWAGQSYAMTLSPEGDYVCHCGGMTYVGVWSYDGCGRFWITESTNYNRSFSTTYAVRLEPWTLAGRVELGAPGTTVRLVRAR